MARVMVNRYSLIAITEIRVTKADTKYSRVFGRHEGKGQGKDCYKGVSPV